MNIYFAGSIRGGRQDAEKYHRIVEHLGKTDRVLTEHVGEVHLKESGTDRDIFRRDMEKLRDADMVVAECTCPSLGVGYELARAETLRKPCYLFYDRNRTDLSAMLSGNPYFHICPYDREEEIFSILDRILGVGHDRIERVTDMEHRLNRLEGDLADRGREKRPEDEIRRDRRILDDYYTEGLWREDFEADEIGEFPQGLPRGVLSEDAVYDLLEAFRERDEAGRN